MITLLNSAAWENTLLSTKLSTSSKTDERVRIIKFLTRDREVFRNSNGLCQIVFRKAEIFRKVYKNYASILNAFLEFLLHALGQEWANESIEEVEGEDECWCVPAGLFVE